MQSYQKLLLANKIWAADKRAENPDYFENLAKEQHPEFLWIGCADSRVPANEITGTEPGEVFVHRNVANLVIHTDLNMLSVLQYAVEVLKVKHIIVAGHYHCGGVKAAITNNDYGLINKWLRNIKEVYEKHEAELIKIEDMDNRVDRLVELNVSEQIKNLAKTTIIQRAWQNGEHPYLHGWVLDLNSGLIKTVVDAKFNDTDFINPIFHYDNIDSKH